MAVSNPPLRSRPPDDRDPRKHTRHRAGFPLVRVEHVPVAVTDLEAASSWFVDWASRRQGGIAVRLVNAHTFASAGGDESYHELLSRDGLNLPDGLPLVKLMNALGAGAAGKARQVRGPSFFLSVLSKSSERGLHHCFIGASPEALAALLRQVRLRYPGVVVSGSYSPPYRAVDEAYVADIMDHVPSGTDVVWIGLGAPKQDFVAQEIAERMHLPVAGVGAAFDYLGGTVVEAPRWVQRFGLEWLFRLAAEPRRLWKRYVMGNAVFVAVAAATLAAARYYRSSAPDKRADPR